VTEPVREPAEWPPVLRDQARASGHDLRNALNGLVVNLEVVRARTESLDESVRLFVRQAVEQAEISVKRAEATIALLNLVADAVGPDGRIEGSVDSSGSGPSVILKSCSRPLPGPKRE